VVRRVGSGECRYRTGKWAVHGVAVGDVAIVVLISGCCGVADLF